MPEFVTEKNVDKTWCPNVQIIIDLTHGIAYTNRGESVKPTELKTVTGCIGAKCGAWVEGPERESVDTTGAEKIDAATGRVKLMNTGRCGLKR